MRKRETKISEKRMSERRTTEVRVSKVRTGEAIKKERMLQEKALEELPPRSLVKARPSHPSLQESGHPQIGQLLLNHRRPPVLVSFQGVTGRRRTPRTRVRLISLPLRCLLPTRIPYLLTRGATAPDYSAYGTE